MACTVSLNLSNPVTDGNLIITMPIGINMNNQQYIVKSSTFNGCNVGIFVSHCFDCVFQNLQFQNCGTAIDMSSSSDGSVALIDSSITTSGTGVKTLATGNGDHSLVIENLQVSSIGSTVIASGKTIVTGSVADTCKLIQLDGVKAILRLIT